MKKTKTDLLFQLPGVIKSPTKFLRTRSERKPWSAPLASLVLFHSTDPEEMPAPCTLGRPRAKEEAAGEAAAKLLLLR